MAQIEMDFTPVDQVKKKREIAAAQAKIKAIRARIEASPCNLPWTERSIDWGPKRRGQGGRSGGMIKGSMSAAPVGVKKYYSVDLSEYRNDETRKDLKILTNHHTAAQYFKARQFGCTHIESMVFAIVTK